MTRNDLQNTYLTLSKSTENQQISDNECQQSATNPIDSSIEEGVDLTETKDLGDSGACVRHNVKARRSSDLGIPDMPFVLNVIFRLSDMKYFVLGMI